MVIRGLVCHGHSLYVLSSDVAIFNITLNAAVGEEVRALPSESEGSNLCLFALD